MKYNFIDLFSGVGGFSAGFKKAKFNHLFSIDINSYCKEVYNLNFPNDIFYEQDITKIDNKTFLKMIGKSRVDVIIGGPPCQGFSTIGKRISSDKNVRLSKDKRNNLVFEFIRLVEVAKPKFFVMENVRGIKTRENGKIFNELLKNISDIGYFFKTNTLNSADYGVPQNRERVFIIGSKKGMNFEFPKFTHGSELLGLKPYETVGSALKGLNKKGIENHVPLKHKEKNIERYKLIPEGGRLPEEKLSKELYRKNFGNTFKRLDRKKPSLTIVPGHNAFPIHPTLNRSLTVREAARLQTFDDSFIFVGPRHEQCIQVGNSVPPKLSYEFAKNIKRCLKKF